MATVSVSSSDLAAVIADATGEPPPKAALAVPEPVKAEPAASEADDVEGPDGLTPRQKREYTTAMLKAIGKKHGRMMEAEEFAAAQYSEKLLAEGQARELREENARLKALAQPKLPEADPDAGKPKRDDFQTEDAFRDAVDDWRVDQRFKARETEALAQRQAQVVESAKANIARALEIVPDYAQVTEAADFIVPDLVAVWMQESPLFAELGYHFAQHPEELGKIAIMPKTKAEVAFKGVVAKLQPFSATTEKVQTDPKPVTDGTTPSPKTDPVPSRPRPSAPITPLSSASSVQVEKAEPEMNVREVITKWSRDNKVNLERRKRH